MTTENEKFPYEENLNSPKEKSKEDINTECSHIGKMISSIGNRNYCDICGKYVITAID